MTELDIQVQRMYRFETDRPLKAFVDITINDALLVRGLRVMFTAGREGGGYWVSMPREQAKDQKWYDTVRCLTEDAKEQISQVVLAAYRERDGGQSIDPWDGELIDDDDVIIP